jgi:hypothetical protein
MSETANKLMSLKEKCIKCFCDELRTFHPSQQFREAANQIMKENGYPKCKCTK